MAFLSAMFIGLTVGIGLIVAFARYEKIRSSRRTHMVFPFHINQTLAFFNIFHVFMTLHYVGKDSCFICKDDSARYKNNSSTRVLSTMGGLFSAPEVELYLCLIRHINTISQINIISFFINTVSVAQCPTQKDLAVSKRGSIGVNKS